MAEISVILPVYNVEKYIAKCLDSVICQTFSDIEILCINDGSTDSSPEIINKYMKKDSRIKLYSQENQGIGAVRNRSLKLATGKYIMFVDPDDWIEPNACELAYKQIEENQNDFVIFNFTYQFEKGDNFLPQKNVYQQFFGILDKKSYDLKNLDTDFLKSCFAWDKIYRKEFLDKNKIEFPHFMMGDDVVFMTQVFIASSSVSILDKHIYNYRVRESSLSFTPKYWRDIITSRDIAYEHVLNNCKSEIFIKNYLNYLIGSQIAWYRQYSQIDKTIKKEFREKLSERFFKYVKYDKKAIIWAVLFKLNLYDLYWYYIREFVKYAVVYPYRKLKKKFCS